MTKNRNRNRTTQRPVGQPVEQAAESKPISVTVNFVGSEPVTLTNLQPEQFALVAEWFKGNRGDVLDLPMGDTVLFLYRRNVTNMVATNKEVEDEKGA